MKVPTAKQLPSGAWFCRIRVRGQDIGITKPTEKEAVAEAMAIKAGVMKQPRQKVAKTVNDCIDEYIDARSSILSPATIRGYRTIQRSRMQLLIDLQVDRVTERLVQRSINQDAQQVSPKTVKNTYALLFSALEDQGIHLETNRLNFPQAKRTEKIIYTREQIAQLLQAVRDTDLEITVLLAAWLGLRRSEICGLKWDCVDLENRKIRIDSAIVYGEDFRPVEKGTKTTASTRTLDCPEYLAQVLEAAPRTSEYVVPIQPNTLSRRFDALLKSEGLPHIGLHNLRHTNASVMLAMGVPDKYAMALGGWSTDATMKQVYQHTMQSELQAAATRRDQYFEELVAPKKRRGRYRIVKYPEDMKAFRR